ncbi:MAG: TIGR03087 family PEP-CTERM/XrtA system glycosyltransferase [Planctomycetes bacterium]|nr:TIGR03087 family PEP-CTERM/XrtA system glycosyltransferase [Planctomycetota bacterium]
MNVLFLSQRVPYPPNRGDKITTWRLVERLRRAHEVRVVAFAHDPADEKAARDLEAMGIPVAAVPYDDRWKKLTSLPLLLTSTPLTLGVYGSRELQREVDALSGWADMAYAYSSSMGAFLERHAHLPRVMHLGELDSDKWRQYSERTGWPMSWVYRREWRTLLEFERRIAHAFTENVLCTPLEQRIFQEQIPGASSVVLRNGVDLEAFAPAPELAEPDHLVFTGVMNYYPNVDGCVWFVDEVLPLVRERHPAARFTIIGAHPSPEVKALEKVAGVRVTGFVDSVTEWVHKGAVAVAPLRIARGIQNKVLEAMACGLPVVGTTSATQGVEGAPGRDYLVADDARLFADHVCALLGDPARARALGGAARAFVEQNYTWETVFRPLDDIVAKCAATRPSADRT